PSFGERAPRRSRRTSRRELSVSSTETDLPSRLNWSVTPHRDLSAMERLGRCRRRPPRLSEKQRPADGGAPQKFVVEALLRRRTSQLKLWPQPQERVALGLLIEKPAPWRPSLKSSVAPLSSGALDAST